MLGALAALLPAGAAAQHPPPPALDHAHHIIVVKMQRKLLRHAAQAIGLHAQLRVKANPPFFLHRSTPLARDSLARPAPRVLYDIAPQERSPGAGEAVPAR